MKRITKNILRKLEIGWNSRSAKKWKSPVLPNGYKRLPPHSGEGGGADTNPKTKPACQQARQHQRKLGGGLRNKSRDQPTGPASASLVNFHSESSALPFSEPTEKGRILLPAISCYPFCLTRRLENSLASKKENCPLRWPSHSGRETLFPALSPIWTGARPQCTHFLAILVRFLTPRRLVSGRGVALGLRFPAAILPHSHLCQTVAKRNVDLTYIPKTPSYSQIGWGSYTTKLRDPFSKYLRPVKFLLITEYPSGFLPQTDSAGVQIAFIHAASVHANFLSACPQQPVTYLSIRNDPTNGKNRGFFRRLFICSRNIFDLCEVSQIRLLQLFRGPQGRWPCSSCSAFPGAHLF